jgi:hypothetical protein
VLTYLKVVRQLFRSNKAIVYDSQINVVRWLQVPGPVDHLWPVNLCDPQSEAVHLVICRPAGLSHAYAGPMTHHMCLRLVCDADLTRCLLIGLKEPLAQGYLLPPQSGNPGARYLLKAVNSPLCQRLRTALLSPASPPKPARFVGTRTQHLRHDVAGNHCCSLSQFHHHHWQLIGRRWRNARIPDGLVAYMRSWVLSSANMNQLLPLAQALISSRTSRPAHGQRLVPRRPSTPRPQADGAPSRPRARLRARRLPPPPAKSAHASHPAPRVQSSDRQA